MKKFIALILVLALVLSLSTVAFAAKRYNTMFNDIVRDLNLGAIVNPVLRNECVQEYIHHHDTMVSHFARQINSYIRNILGQNDASRAIARTVAESITYVWSICGRPL